MIFIPLLSASTLPMQWATLDVFASKRRIYCNLLHARAESLPSRSSGR